MMNPKYYLKKLSYPNTPATEILILYVVFSHELNYVLCPKMLIMLFILIYPKIFITSLKTRNMHGYNECYEKNKYIVMGICNT